MSDRALVAPELLAELFPAGASAPPWVAAFVAATLAVGLVSGLYLASRYAPSMLPRPMNRRDNRVTFCFCLIAGLLLCWLIYFAAVWICLTRRHSWRPQ